LTREVSECVLRKMACERPLLMLRAVALCASRPSAALRWASPTFVNAAATPLLTRRGIYIAPIPTNFDSHLLNPRYLCNRDKILSPGNRAVEPLQHRNKRAGRVVLRDHAGHDRGHHAGTRLAQFMMQPLQGGLQSATLCGDYERESEHQRIVPIGF